MLFSEKLDKKHFISGVNALVALFFVTVLTFNKGYSYAPMILGTISTIAFLVYRFKFKIKWQLDKEDKYFIFSLITYFFTFMLSVVINHDSLRVIDNPSRILLLIPMLFLFRLYPVKQNLLFYMMPIGALVVGVLAIYQKFILGLPKPFPETMHIQAGNIAITLGLFSIAIAFYWFNKQNHKMAFFTVLCAALGLLASILTGARGGWVAFPFVFLLILAFNFKQINKKVIVVVTLLFVTAITIFITKPEFGIQKRYNEARSDVISYFEKSNKNSSLGARFDMWENAIIAIAEKPIFGHGSQGYDQFRERQMQKNEMAKTTQFNSLHNQFLEAFVKRGLGGFIALIAILAVPLIIFARRLKSANIAVKCIAILGIVHIVAHSFFSLSQSFFAHNSGSLFYFFVLIILYHLLKQKEYTS